MISRRKRRFRMKKIELKESNFNDFGDIIEVDDRFCVSRKDDHRYY